MRDRLLVAGLFSAAAVLFWLGYWVLTRDGAAFAFGGVSTLATLLVGALAAPRLAADARQSGDPGRGWGAGALVTLAAFVLGAFLFALLPLFTTDTVGSTGVLDIVGGVVWLFSMGLLVGLLFLFAALPVGMWVGWLFYKLRGPSPAGAV